MKNRKPKADGRYIVNVSFTANETSLLSWADSHGNFSNYVKKLIQADMNKKEMTENIPAELIQRMMLNMMTQGSMNTINKNDEISVDASVDVDDEEREVQPPQKTEKKKLNKSAIGNIMKKKV